MVALCNRADHYIFMLFMAALCNRGPLYFCPVVSFFLLSSSSFFPRLISAATDWMSTILLQVWNVLHAARCKCRTQKSRQKSPSGHHRTTLSGYIFATKAYVDNRKKLVKQQYLPCMSPQYGELRPTSGWDPFVSLAHPMYFQRVSRLGSVTARHSSSGRQPNCGVEQRAPPIFGRAVITLGIGPYF